MTTIRTMRHTLRAVYLVPLLLSIFYACEDDIGSVDTDPLRVFDEWIANNKAHNLVATTAGTPISTREALEQMTVDGEYHLTANIDLEAVRSEDHLTDNIDLEIKNWTPLFSKDEPFTGTLHGNGYIIYNLNINAPEANYQGLFAALSGATVKNLAIGVKAIYANAMAGALAGSAENETIVENDKIVVISSLDVENIIVAGLAADSQITVDGEVEGPIVISSYTGALFGLLWSGDANVSRLINEGLMVKAIGSVVYSNVGGLVGANAGKISESRSSGVVSVHSGQHVGGLVGINTHSIIKSSATGAVRADSGENVGGLVGYNVHSIVESSASGAVSTVSDGGQHAGGLVGFNRGTMHGSASGDVSTGAGQFVGGLVGRNEGTVRGSASGTVSSKSGDFVGGLVGRNYNTVYGSASGNVSTQSGNSVGGLLGSNAEGGAVYGSATGNVSTQFGQYVGGLVGYNRGVVRGAASGTVSTQFRQYIGGLVGWTTVATVDGYSIGWVMVAQGNANIDIGAVVGASQDTADPPNPIALNSVYYYSVGGDHVGSIDVAPENAINAGDADDTGARGTNGIGTGIDDIARATATNMPNFTVGAEEGKWTFTAGEWPGINLPEGVVDYMDYRTSPPHPRNFVD